MPLRIAVLLTCAVALSACSPSTETTWHLTYPDGKTKALVLSYDDGPIEDIQLARLFDQYDLVGTFNLNSGYLGMRRGWPQPDGDTVYQQYIPLDSMPSVYARHEIAAHGTFHKNFTEISDPEILEEVTTDVANLERITGRTITSLAYPFGNSNKHIAEMVQGCGITNARTVSDTRRFNLPNNFQLWHPTIHDSKAMELAAEYQDLQTDELTVFYVWGHAWELKDPARWNNIKSFCQTIAHQEDIWYVSNGELAEYLLRLQKLEQSPTEIRNP